MEKVIINEVLCFIKSKMDVMEASSVITICASFYKPEEVEAAKSKLRELEPENTNGTTGGFRWTNRVGEGKLKRNLEDILSAFQAINYDHIRFVALDLNNLPPVSFNSLDASALLAKLEKLTAEMQTMQSVQTSMQEVQSRMQSVVGNIIQPTGNKKPVFQPNQFPELPRSDRAAQPVGGKRRSHSEAVPTRDGDQASGGDDATVGLQGTNSVGGVDDTSGRAPTEGQWRLALSRGIKNGLRKNANKKTQIIGSNHNTQFNAVQGKISVFTTRWNRDINPKSVSEYLSRRLKTNVDCVNLNLKSTAYVSMKITAVTNNRNIFFNPELWPNGVVVTKFFQPRNISTTNSANGESTTTS